MKKILIPIVMLMLMSCSSYDNGHGLAGLGAAGAGTLAWQLTKGKSSSERMMWTGASALGAFALGEYVRSQVISSQEEKYSLGYTMGLADATKNQYEIIQNRQKENSPALKNRFSIYEFPGVPNRDGVNFAPHTVKLRIQE